MTTTWFVSDTHFSHQNIIDYCDRPYRDSGGNPDVSKMNEILIRNWNTVVAPDDWVMCLGDMVMGDRDQTLPILGRLLGRKILVAGNHDYCWEHAKKADMWLPKYAPHFEAIVTKSTWVFPNGTVVNLHHFPYAGDSHETDRYSKHRLPDEGVPLLHGHVHEKWLSRRSPKGTPMINVGIDVHGYAPVSEDEVFELLQSMS